MDWKKSLLGLGLFFLVVIMTVAAYSYFNGIKFIDSACYEAITKEECPGQNTTIFKEFANPDYVFRCCDYSHINQKSRYKWDHKPVCNTYVFIEEDHKRCSSYYKHFKRVW